ncbi:MAG: DNA-binding response regulator [Firmicutes bacterium HGW-Firmicutes-1]|jgi:DNA-binding response OmpR family regulator|nr:MAG: DNA-binding response regulator [Firmicutes bacterium HGW-Firmicutes-1]
MGLEKSILIVDDEVKIVSVIESYLIHNGYTVFKAYNGKDALEIFTKELPSLVVLDLMLPDISGEDVCHKLRNISRVPIIMLTAKVSEEDILNGLDLGADDYITKPFSPKQLMARIGAVLRRCTADREFLSNVISFNHNDLVINVLKREVQKNSQVIKLTPNEYNILLTLIKFSEKTFTRDELISIALGDDFDGFDRTVDTHIKNLRQKIEDDPKNPLYILTVFGVGYRFDARP